MPKSLFFRSKKTLQILEGVDDVLEGDDINLLKCSDDDVDETYGIGFLPRLIYFKRGIPKPYEGNERDVEEITAGARKQIADSKPYLNKASSIL